jgi:hypothetical protein
MPRVLNKYKDEIPPDAVYIGRGSPWGNPWAIRDELTREDVIAAYEAYVSQHPSLRIAIREALAGKDLVCFCAPKQCHGDILLRIANQGENDD